VPCEWAERDESQCDQLFLTVEPSEAGCGCVVLGPTLQMLERVDPRLPATFFHLLVGALNCWTRTYDYRDAEERVETLREWIAAEPDADQYELPDVAGCIPPCMRQPPMEEDELARIQDKIRDSLARKLVEATLGLKSISAQAERPDLSEDVRQLLCDCNRPALAQPARPVRRVGRCGCMSGR